MQFPTNDDDDVNLCMMIEYKVNKADIETAEAIANNLTVSCEPVSFSKFIN
jgi:hypothetical protein